MRIEYLTWFKHLEEKLHKGEGCHILLSSAVATPWELLDRELAEFAHGAARRFRYSYTWGHELLKEMIAGQYGVTPENVLTTNGVSSAIFLLSQALISPGDHVVIEWPCYEPLLASPDFTGARISYVPRRPPDFRLDVGEMSKALTEKTKLIFITNPHNPSGVFDKDHTVLELVDAVQQKCPQARVVIDEIYRDFVPGPTFAAFAPDRNIISLNSLTKVYGLAMIHCGWVIAQQEVIAKLREIHTLAEGSNSCVTEVFASFVMEKLNDYLNFGHDIVDQNRRELANHMEALISNGVISGSIPEYSWIYFPRVNGIQNTDGLARRLAEEFAVYVVPGRFFGEPGHIRIGFGSPPETFRSDIAAFANALLSLHAAGALKQI